MDDGDNLVVLGVLFIKTVGTFYRCGKGFQGKGMFGVELA
jgi:hypothetical protein